MSGEQGLTLPVVETRTASCFSLTASEGSRMAASQESWNRSASRRLARGPRSAATARDTELTRKETVKTAGCARGTAERQNARRDLPWSDVSGWSNHQQQHPTDIPTG